MVNEFPASNPQDLESAKPTEALSNPQPTSPVQTGDNAAMAPIQTSGNSPATLAPADVARATAAIAAGPAGEVAFTPDAKATGVAAGPPQTAPVPQEAVCGAAAPNVIDANRAASHLADTQQNDPIIAAELHQKDLDAKKTVAETRKLRAEKYKLDRESTWFSAFLSPAGAAVLITAVGLSTTYFTGWFDSQSKLLESNRNLLKAETTSLTTEKNLLTRDKDSLAKETHNLTELRTNLIKQNDNLQKQLEQSGAVIKTTEGLFAAFVETGATIGPFNEDYRLEFSLPTGPGAENRKLATPKKVLSIIKQGGYADVVRKSLIGSITAVWFLEVEVDASDIEALAAIERLESVMLFYPKGNVPNAATSGFEKIGKQIQHLTLRGEFSPNSASVAIAAVPACKELHLEKVKLTDEVSRAIYKLKYLRTLTLDQCMFTNDMQSSGTQFPSLTTVRVVSFDNKKQIDGDMLLWLDTAPGLGRIDFHNIVMTTKLATILLRLDPVQVENISLYDCRFNPPELREKLSIKFGNKLLVVPPL